MITRRTLLGASVGLVPLSAYAGTALAGDGDAGLRGSIDASDLGLSPGAPDNQSPAFRQALSRASASGRPLFLPPGAYQIAEIDLPDPTHIVGIPGESRIVFRGGRFLLRAERAGRVRLEGLHIDGAGQPMEDSALVTAFGVPDVVIRDCVVSGAGRSGIRLEGCAGAVDANRIEDCADVGLHLVGSRGMSVHDNAFADIGNTGILVQRHERGPDDTIVRGNRVTRVRADSGGTGQYGNAINVVQADNVIVADNRIDDCAFSAVRAYSSSNTRISGNVATRIGETALYVEFAFEGAVVSDNIVEDAAMGISFANLMDYGGRLCVASGNLIRNLRPTTYFPAGGSGRYGIGISVEADAALSGNVVEDAALYGLQLGWGPYLRDVAATGNVIRRASVGIAVSVVEGAGATLIAGNLIEGSERAAVLGMRWAEPVTGDLTRAGAETFPHLSIARNRVS